MGQPAALATQAAGAKCGIFRGTKSTSMSTRSHCTGVLDERNVIGGFLKGKKESGAELVGALHRLREER
jgi:hypothetical protein